MKMHAFKWKLVAGLATAVVCISGCATNPTQIGAADSENAPNLASADSLGAQMFNTTPRTDVTRVDAN